ncbi:Hypothetical protein FSTVST1_262 [Faustovirus ST1]|nr:Hypothetical protein FSTVST1_262 [Faustovirus ST1]
MDALPVEIKTQIIAYCNLSACSMVNRVFNAIAGNIQANCISPTCIRCEHPKCALKRPYTIANIACETDNILLLKFLKRNLPAKWEKIKYYCAQRWDIYKSVTRYITGKNNKRPALPLSDSDLVIACHYGRRILSGFAASINPLPLRGLAANHALKYNSKAKFINLTNSSNVESVTTIRVNGVSERVVDISVYFHNHQLVEIKRLFKKLTVYKIAVKAHIRYFDSHIGVCASITDCNCLDTCKWLIKHGLLSRGLSDSYKILTDMYKRLE